MPSAKTAGYGNAHVECGQGMGRGSATGSDRRKVLRLQIMKRVVDGRTGVVPLVRCAVALVPCVVPPTTP